VNVTSAKPATDGRPRAEGRYLGRIDIGKLILQRRMLTSAYGSDEFFRATLNKRLGLLFRHGLLDKLGLHSLLLSFVQIELRVQLRLPDDELFQLCFVFKQLVGLCLIVRQSLFQLLNVLSQRPVCAGPLPHGRGPTLGTLDLRGYWREC